MSRLLKSCAMPPARSPRLSSLCVCCQLRLPLATGHFGSHPLATVPQQPAQADEPPLAVADPARGQGDGKRRTTPRLDRGLPLRHAFRVSVVQPRHICREGPVRFAGHEHDNGLPSQQIPADAQQASRDLVRLLDRAFWIGHQVTVRGVVDSSW